MNINETKKPVIEQALNLFTLPLISQFKYYQFSGRADNTNLFANFNLADIRNRYLIIKAIKIVPYYEVASIDLYMGVDSETIPALARINRVFDVYDFGSLLTVEINGVAQPIFPSEVLNIGPNVGGNIPLDLDIDNIYYKYPEKISTFNIRLDSQIFSNIETGAVDQPLVKVFFQVYVL